MPTALERIRARGRRPVTFRTAVPGREADAELLLKFDALRAVEPLSDKSEELYQRLLAQHDELLDTWTLIPLPAHEFEELLAAHTGPDGQVDDDKLRPALLSACSPEELSDIDTWADLLDEALTFGAAKALYDAAWRINTSGGAVTAGPFVA